MTSLISQPGKNVKLQSTSLVALESAIGGESTKIAEQIQAFRNDPPPASLGPQTLHFSDKKIQEHLFDALASVKILTAQVAMHLSREWRDKLFTQLDSLHDPEEWEQGDKPVQQSSFATFLKAMLSINPTRRPGLGLSSAGQLIGAWTNKQDRLTIEFLPNDRVRWVLSKKYDDEIERFAGETSVVRLTEGLSAHHPEHWFLNAEKSS